MGAVTAGLQLYVDEYKPYRQLDCAESGEYNMEEGQRTFTMKRGRLILTIGWGVQCQKRLRRKKC
jgi:hypothetical protein